MKYYPLRPIQRWLVDTHFNKAKSTMMNIGALLKMSHAIDMEYLAKAVNQVLNAHDIFRCRFVFHPETSDLCQTFDGEIPEVKVKKISDEEFDERMEKLREPYKMIDRPLWRIYVIETPTAKYLYVDFYHAVMDGVAVLYLFWREVDAVYRGRNKRNPPPSYAEYVEEESKISAEELAKGHAYWKNMLADFDAEKHLPPVKVAGSVAKWTPGNFNYKFKNIFNEFFRRTHVIENNFFLAATMLTLAKITGTKKSVMSRISNGRTDMRERRLMGLMLEQFPCAWDFTEDIYVGEFLARLEGQNNIGLRYRKSLDVVYDERLEDDCVRFVFQKNLYQGLIFCDNPVEVVYLPPNEISAVENALDVEINLEDSGRYSFYMKYDASRYSETDMKNFAETLDKIILAMQNLNARTSEILKG